MMGAPDKPMVVGIETLASSKRSAHAGAKYYRARVIFDIDGTLADISHRLHYLTNLRKPGEYLRGEAKHKHPDWAAFNDAMVNDVPKWPIVALAQMIRGLGHNIIIVTGRPETHRRSNRHPVLRHSIGRCRR